MKPDAAGILLFRRVHARLEVLIVHPGGPYWAGKNEGAWSIPKGLIEPDEDPLEAAKREFQEETGSKIKGRLTYLGTVKQSGGKGIHAWTREQDFDTTKFRSNEVKIRWPPKSNNIITIPEIDKAEWFPISRAKKLVNKAQVEFLERLQSSLKCLTWAKKKKKVDKTKKQKSLLMSRGAFEIPGSELFCSFRAVCQRNNREKDQERKTFRGKVCKSENIEVVSRDPVWEETWFRCRDCGYEWCKG